MRHSKSRSARFARAFTIAELLTVTVLFGLLLTTVAVVIPAVLHSPSQMQAQVDEVDAAALALYKVQRDARQGDVNGVFNCTIAPVVACAQVTGSIPAITQAIAIAGDDGSGQFVYAKGQYAGQTKWQGYVVYWLAPSTTGVGLDLMRVFEYVTIGFKNNLPIFQPSDAVTSVTAAITASSPSVAAPDVRQLLSSVTPANGIIALSMMVGVNRGDQTSITLQGNTYARN